MLSWALRYLAVAVVVAIGFAALQGSDWLPSMTAKRTAERTVVDRSRGHAAAPAPEETWDEPDPENTWDQPADDGAGPSGAANAWSGQDEDAAADQDEGWSEEGDAQNDAGPADEDGGDLEMVIRAGPNGHFVLEAEVNGAPIRFLVDTGASDVVLSPADARRLGFDPQSLRYTLQYRTANGTVRGAPVTLRDLRAGALQLYDLDASVVDTPLAVSLLGMSFLRQLGSYQVADGRLILRW
ncbi:MAG: retropepsin-like aspartic protease family protein [Geminicoccaceae bacterium]